MSKLERNALLPTGLRDVLPPDAGFEADVVARRQLAAETVV